MAKGKYKYWIFLKGLLKLESWAREGLTNEQIASSMGISISGEKSILTFLTP